jgi:hypothetical protein
MTVDSERSAPEPVAAATSSARGLRRFAAIVVCVLASGAFLLSFLIVLLFLALTPYPGMETPILVAKAAIVVGWLLLGLWLAVEVVRLRFRAAIPASLAWAWCVLFWTVPHIGYIQYGY